MANLLSRREATKAIGPGAMTMRRMPISIAIFCMLAFCMLVIGLAAPLAETGYVSRPQRAGTRIDPGSPQKQAQWARLAFQQAFDLGVERMYWLFLKDHAIGQYFDSMGCSTPTEIRAPLGPS
jgi:hypothetical protein